MDGGTIDGLNMLPRPGEPESNLIAGMAAVKASQAVIDTFSVFGGLSMPDTSQPQPVALQSPNTWVYDFDPANGSARATFNGEVNFTSGGSATAGVTTWNGRSGAVTLTTADVTGAGGAPIASPTFTGSPAAPTPTPGNASTLLATTAFVGQAIAAQTLVSAFNGRTGAITLTTSDVTSAGGAPLASPSFTGTPQAPTPVNSDSSSSLATTAFVKNVIASGAVSSFNGRQGAVTLTLSDVTTVGGAPINSPVFTGVPAATTATPGTATTQIATTAFVINAVQAATVGVSSFNTRTGAVTLTAADVTAAGGALLAGPALTGVPTAPTATAGTSTTQLATTAFVANALSAAPGVTSFNGRGGVVTLTTADVTTAGGAPAASPTLTGTVTIPTPAPGDNSTKAASTAFVTTSFAPLASPALTGTPTVPTATPGTATTQAASTAFVAAALAPLSTAREDNRIVNPNGLISQENGTGAVTTGGGYMADQWRLDFSGVVVGASSGALTTPSPFGTRFGIALNVTTVKASLAAGDYMRMVQPIEGWRIADFCWGTPQAKPVVLRLNAYCDTPGSYTLGVGNGAQTYSFTKLLALTAGWQTLVVSVPAQVAGVWPTDTTGALFVWICGGSGTTFTAGADNAWAAGNFVASPGQSNLAAITGKFLVITDVGLYIDPAATGLPPAWMAPDYETEFVKCQRYWQWVAIGFWGNVTNTSNYLGFGKLAAMIRTGSPTFSGAINITASAFPNTIGAFSLFNWSGGGISENRTSNAAGVGGWESVVGVNARM